MYQKYAETNDPRTLITISQQLDHELNALSSSKRFKHQNVVF